MKSDVNQNYFIGETERDRASPGMSGSPVFNKKGELVGVQVVKALGPFPVYGGGRGYGGAVTEDMPSALIEKLSKIDEQKGEFAAKLIEIEGQIHKLLNPEVHANVSVSPEAILKFLKDYCDSTKPSAVQSSVKSRAERSLEQATADLMIYGSGNNPPRSIEQKIHPGNFTKGGWLKKLSAFLMNFIFCACIFFWKL